MGLSGIDETDEISLLVHYAHSGSPKKLDITFLSGCGGRHHRVLFLDRMKFTIPMYFGCNVPVHDKQSKIYLGSNGLLFTFEESLVTCPDCEKFIEMMKSKIVEESKIDQ